MSMTQPAFGRFSLAVRVDTHGLSCTKPVWRIKLGSCCLLKIFPFSMATGEKGEGWR